MARRVKKEKAQAPGTITVNRQARHDYEIEETFEAGVVLTGTEVKSLRLGRVQLKDAYARVRDAEVFLHRCHIGPYPHARDNHEPERVRKLLLHGYQIRRLIGKTERAGYTLVPMKMYFKGPRVKVELALARGKARHEKRDQIKKRVEEREMRQQAVRHRV